MDFLKFAEEARTCRRFDESLPLAGSDLKWLLECARLAPSARNAQELRFISVSWGETCRRLLELCRMGGSFKDWNRPPPGQRPTGFIAVLMPERGGDLLCYDTGIACQTMQLAAASRGWGACMIQAFERAGASELLNVPAGSKIALLMAFGVAGEKRVVAKMPANGSHSYWRDENDVHNVPKRDLDELIVKAFES